MAYSAGPNQADLGSNHTANEIAVLLGGTAAGYERAFQAVREVRHLLPADGVAIVNAVWIAQRELRDVWNRDVPVMHNERKVDKNTSAMRQIAPPKAPSSLRTNWPSNEPRISAR